MTPRPAWRRGLPIRGFRCPDDLWAAATRKAAAEGRARGVSEVIVEHLREWVSAPPDSTRQEV